MKFSRVTDWLRGPHREWAEAMEAEMAHITDPAERARFARGCWLVAFRPHLMAAAGLLSLAPFAIANWIIVHHVEPWFTWIRPGIHTSALEYALIAALLLLMPAGAVAAVSPMLPGTAARGRWAIYPMNGVVAVLLMAIFLALAWGLGSDIYACDVLRIPNCD